MDLLLFLKIEILCWRIMTPSLRGGSISLGYLATGPARGLGNLHFQSQRNNLATFFEVKHIRCGEI
ncbi:hypothetical protein D6219_02645 [Coxiella burnetii]|nr:hypothetical protein D6219_02645 [Coxiella burnetii]PNT86478.1 hypothetical protein C2L93_02510 [Coxiella burnetii]QCP56875.1 hypothetical protein FDP44_09785 [Coxiella burnetii]